MLRYFRINDPYRLLGLLALLTLLSLPFWIDPAPLTRPELHSFIVGEKVAEGFSLYTEIIDSTPPLASWFYGLCDMIFGRSLTARHVSTFIILFLQSAFWGIILIDKKVFTENTYIPSVLFSLLTIVSFDFQMLSADIAAFGFLLLTLNALLTEIEFRVQRDETIFNIGLFISLATLFNFSYILYLPGVILLLILFTRTSPRKYLLLVTGFLLPHALLISFYYLTNEHYSLWERFYWTSLQFPTNTWVSIKSMILLAGVPLFMLLLSLFVLNREARLTNYQTQVFQTMFLLFVIASVQIYFTADLRPQSLLPLIPAISFFLTHFFLIIRRRKFFEAGFWILLIGLTTTTYLVRYHKISSIELKNLYVQPSDVAVTGKKILVLGQGYPDVYANSSLAPAFINWPLTKRILDNPGSYENVLLINSLMLQDLPDMIIDPENKMEKFFYRLPDLQAHFKRGNSNTWIKLSN